MYALGRKVSHDPRSLAYPAKTAPLRSVHHRHWGAALDQGRVSSCTGNAIAQALNTTPLRHGRPLLTEHDALNLYATATTLDEFPGEYPEVDEGSSGLAVAKAAQQAGLISSYTHAFGLHQALAALVLSPLIIGVDWYDGMFDVSGTGYIYPTGTVVGGHEIAVIALDVKHASVTLLNSWGPGWGRGGKAYLRWDDLDLLLSRQGDVTIPVL
jgi:hypothetical protein